MASGVSAPAGYARAGAPAQTKRAGPTTVETGPLGQRMLRAYLVSGDSFGSLAYASAALSFVTMTGGSKNAGTILLPLS